MSENLITVHVADGVATLVLNNPSSRNALSREMVAELDDVLDDIERQDLRCLEIRGASGVFSAGGDIDKMVERFDKEVDIDAEVQELSRTTSRLIARVATFPLPTVARLTGPAYGAGATLAIACDLQFAHPDAVLAFAFARVGLAIDSGTSYLLPRLVGMNVAKYLVFTGNAVGAQEAAELGLVNDVFDEDEFDERVDELVDQIADGPTVALRQDKRLLNQAFEKSINQAVSDEALAQGIALQTADHEEGVEAFFDERTPSFSGR